MANMKIEDIDGIGPAYGEKLRGAGIADTDTLLQRGAQKTGRKEIAETCDISEKRVLDWVNMSDLFRVKGIGPEYAELLEASGVDTVKELAQRNAENLAEKCAEVNAEKKLTRRVPSSDAISEWVIEAKGLPRVIEY